MCYARRSSPSASRCRAGAGLAYAASSALISAAAGCFAKANAIVLAGDLRASRRLLRRHRGRADRFEAWYCVIANAAWVGLPFIAFPLFVAAVAGREAVKPFFDWPGG